MNDMDITDERREVKDNLVRSIELTILNCRRRRLPVSKALSDLLDRANDIDQCTSPDEIDKMRMENKNFVIMIRAMNNSVYGLK